MVNAQLRAGKASLIAKTKLAKDDKSFQQLSDAAFIMVNFLQPIAVFALLAIAVMMMINKP